MTTTTVSRPYGAGHVAERKRWESLLNAGHTTLCNCAHADCVLHPVVGACPTLITSADEWDLGHDDDRVTWVGPECVPCNRADGARKSRVSVQNPMTVRGWCEPIVA